MSHCKAQVFTLEESFSSTVLQTINHLPSDTYLEYGQHQIFPIHKAHLPAKEFTVDLIIPPLGEHPGEILRCTAPAVAALEFTIEQETYRLFTSEEFAFVCLPSHIHYAECPASKEVYTILHEADKVLVLPSQGIKPVTAFISPTHTLSFLGQSLAVRGTYKYS